MRLAGKSLTLIACLFGVYVAIQLLGIHVDASIGDAAGAASQCSSGGGCFSAATSSYATLFGMPIAALGFAFYVAAIAATIYSFAVDSTPGEDDADLPVAGLLAFGFVLACGYSAFLAWVNLTQLPSSCGECVKLYVVNGLGLFAALLWLGLSGIRSFFSRVVGHLFGVHTGVFVVTFAVALAGSIWKTKADEATGIEELANKQVESSGQNTSLGFPVGDPSLLIAEHSPTWGSETAVVTLVEFSDFQCPYCARLGEVLNELKEEFDEGELRMVFRHFPLAMHPRAREAAKAAVCVADSADFWPFHDLIFDSQHNLSDERLQQMAAQVGVDRASLSNCMESQFAEERVALDRRNGEELGIQGTPTIYINGRPYEGSLETRALTATIRQLLGDEEAQNDSAAGDSEQNGVE